MSAPKYRPRYIVSEVTAIQWQRSGANWREIVDFLAGAEPEVGNATKRGMPIGIHFNSPLHTHHEVLNWGDYAIRTVDRSGSVVYQGFCEEDFLHTFEPLKEARKRVQWRKRKGLRSWYARKNNAHLDVRRLVMLGRDGFYAQVDNLKNGMGCVTSGTFTTLAEAQAWCEDEAGK